MYSEVSKQSLLIAELFLLHQNAVCMAIEKQSKSVVKAASTQVKRAPFLVHMIPSKLE